MKLQNIFGNEVNNFLITSAISLNNKSANAYFCVKYYNMQINNRYQKFLSLRKEYHQFTYQSFDYSINADGISMEFNFNIDNDFAFNPHLFIPQQNFIDFNRITKTLLDQLVFNIGMVELISYWKAICPIKVNIIPFNLNQDQINFWKKIYYHGLGEFFYLNGIEINMGDFMQIVPNEEKPFMKAESVHVDDSTIIPVGGGKDSVVSLELLKNQGNNLALIMNPRGASTATANVGGFQDATIIIRRFLDTKLLSLNEQGFLNGHTPFSALLAFVSFLAAAVSGKKYIALSNESSANESTVVGTMVNHQYSKSLEFESDFRNYSQQYLSPDIHYFSLLRPLSELQIASVFAKNESYFQDFRSCNAGSKTNSWCGKCSKCLFTYIILSPFVQPKKLVEIFGNNLLDDVELKLFFDELTGIAEVKPFECVGTVDEVNLALCFFLSQYEGEKPFLLQYFVDKGMDKSCSSINIEEVLKTIETEHFLEPKFLNLIQQKLKS